MKKNKYSIYIVLSFVTVFIFTACEDFFFPEQKIDITEDKLFKDWYEYRSVAIGLYQIQTELVEQILILGELRGDLLQVTENADADLIEIYNFNVSKQNKYVSPTNFFKLISACNNFIRILEKNHPEVLDPASQVTNYDRLYGEVLCMRAWAYFNAVRIYGKVPFIHESLTTVDEVDNFLASSGEYVDSVDITYARNGYDNDTSYNTPISLDKQYYDQRLVIDYFTQELENKVKAVGVNHSINNNDITWEVTIWNTYAMNALLGIMYLTDGDLARATEHFEKIVFNNTEFYRYQNAFYSNLSWRNIFEFIANIEHILTADFNKGSYQQNGFQELFDPRPPHKYMLKPTRKAVLYWETIWDDYTINEDRNNPEDSEIANPGRPGDFYRGYGVSYGYVRNGELIDEEEIQRMLLLKSKGDFRSASLIVSDADTVVWKYSWNKDVYDQDADFIFYRSASVHLWLAEIYNHMEFLHDNGLVYNETGRAEGFLNDARGIKEYPTIANMPQLGVRGRVGFGGETDGVRIRDNYYIHDPFTNEIIGYQQLTNQLYQKQLLFEQAIIDERARELAFEGERFYDLVRVAKRRNNPSYLASRVSEKFPPGKREAIYNLLLNEENWYINYFE